MNPLKLAVFLLPLVASTGISCAQPAKIKIYFQTDASDVVGRQLVFMLKDKIRASATFTETLDENNSFFIVDMVTIDPSVSGDGLSTIYAFDILLENDKGFNYFLTQFVGVCGSQKVESCASDLYRYIGEELEKLNQITKNKSNT
jgi:hypothetical protein